MQQKFLESIDTTPGEKDQYLNMKDLSIELGVSYKTIQGWCWKIKHKRTGRGKVKLYSLNEVKLHISHLRDKEREKNSGEKVPLLTESRAKKTNIEYLQKKFNFEREKGEWIERVKIEEILQKLGTMTHQRLMRIPNEESARLVGMSQEQIKLQLQTCIDEACEPIGNLYEQLEKSVAT